MKRYNELFQNLKKENEKAFIPFIILGDPNIEISLKIIDSLIDGGADALEIGIPFSDPLADGPIIQKSISRAITNGITISLCFKALQNIREKHPNIPIGLLIYANLIINHGIDSFYSKSAKLGVDSVLIADLPLEESSDFSKAAIHHGIAPIFTCPPNANENHLINLGVYGKGYIYLVSYSGVSGLKKKASKNLPNLIKKLKTYNTPPPIQGFGISKTNQIKKAISNGAEGIISGSAIIKIIEKPHTTQNHMLLTLKKLAKNFKLATLK